MRPLVPFKNENPIFVACYTLLYLLIHQFFPLDCEKLKIEPVLLIIIYSMPNTVPDGN